MYGLGFVARFDNTGSELLFFTTDPACLAIFTTILGENLLKSGCRREGNEEVDSDFDRSIILPREVYFTNTVERLLLSEIP